MKRKTKLPFGLSDPYVRENRKKSHIARWLQRKRKKNQTLEGFIGVYPVTFKQGGPRLIRWILRRLGAWSKTKRPRRGNPEREYEMMLHDKYDRQESSFYGGEMIHGPTSTYREREEDEE